jgi:putative endonuclease
MFWSKLRALLPANSPAPDSGSQGERLASVHLQRDHGFRLVASNWRNPTDRREEIDLVMRDGEVLVFVEVKTRSARAIVSGYHAVTAKKKKVLRRACAAYLARLKPRPATFRFDVVEVELPPAGTAAEPIVRHYSNVPLFRQDYW